MGIHDRKYMSDNTGSSLGGGPKSFTTKYVIVCSIIYLLDVLLEKSLTNNLCFNPQKVYDFEVWRLFSAFVMFTEYDGAVNRILGLIILYMLGKQFEEQIGSKNYINLFITISLGQMIVAVLIPQAFNLGYFSGILSGLFVAYGVLLGSRKITIKLYFLIPLTLSGHMLVAFIVGVLVLLTLANQYPWVITVPVLGGCFAAYVFITQYQKGQIIDLLGFLKKKAKPKQKNASPPKPSPMNTNQAKFTVLEEEEEIDDVDAFIQEKIDPILEKIATSGMSSLTSKEKKLLEEAKKKMGK